MTTEHEDNTPLDGGQVFYLPGADDVVDAEIVHEPQAPGTQLEARERTTFGTRRLIPIEARERMASGAVVLSHRAAPIAKTGTKAAGREMYSVAKGAAVVAKRLWEARTNSGYRRDLREARAQGDRELYLEIEARGEAARERRHKRRMELIKEAPMALVQALAVGTATMTGLLLVLGIVLAIAQKDAGLILSPIAG